MHARLLITGSEVRVLLSELEEIPRDGRNPFGSPAFFLSDVLLVSDGQRWQFAGVLPTDCQHGGVVTRGGRGHRRPPWRARERRERRVDVAHRDGSVVFTRRVTAYSHRDSLPLIADAIAAGAKELVLDFGQVRLAYASGMVPMICTVDVLKRQGVAVSVILPTDPDLRHLFFNTNWANQLDPRLEAYDVTFHRHLSVRRFRDFKEQQAVVNAFLDIVMRNALLSRDQLAGLEWSINEITDNVLNHAEAQDGGLVQVTAVPDTRLVYFTVADSGRGILASMRDGFPALPDDASAIGEAVKAGVTSDPKKGQGNGLAGTLRIATLSGGNLEVMSGSANLVITTPVDGSPVFSKTYRRPPAHHFEGTVVSALLGNSATFHIPDALGFPGRGNVYDIIESKYETESGDALMLKLKDETPGAGTRHAGRQIRTKCLNLLGADRTKALVVDWDGVPLISSSFADEAIGKLFVELGPMTFSARVRNVNMEPFVRGLVDKAIMQRVAQSATSKPHEDLGDDELING
jgi:anti-sigma regulatory factor (Ser/Thr protein kinase)